MKSSPSTHLMVKGQSIAMQGARAIDPVEGDVSMLITACQSGYYVSVVGLQGCRINTSVPGNTSITFSISEEGSHVASFVTRTLVVLPTCSLGDVPCSTGQCGSFGLCSDGFPLVMPVNHAPVLQPQTSGAVAVAAGTHYERCTSASILGKCEDGVVATDSEDGDLTPKVLACPPQHCMPFGCPGHEFMVKGDLSAQLRRCHNLSFAWCCMRPVGTFYLHGSSTSNVLA
jgi:hypothetical protein